MYHGELQYQFHWNRRTLFQSHPPNPQGEVVETMQLFPRTYSFSTPLLQKIYYPQTIWSAFKHICLPNIEFCRMFWLPLSWRLSDNSHRNHYLQTLNSDLFLKYLARTCQFFTSFRPIRQGTLCLPGIEFRPFTLLPPETNIHLWIL